MTILKEYRINNKINQNEMAKKLNCSLSSYRLYENGYQDIPRRVLLAFLRLRAKDSDLDLADMLEEVYEK